MLCARTREWLMHAEQPADASAAPPDIVGHLHECSGCRNVRATLERTERVWREQPLPASSALARDTVLRRHAESVVEPRRVERRFVVRWMVAASLVVGLGVLVSVLNQPPRVQAQPDVIDQLIDWNLQLSESTAPDERRELFVGRVETLKADVGRLPAEDRDFGESLLRNGEWLAVNDEPLEAADRFGVLADQVVERLNRAARNSDSKAAARTAKQYEYISTVGIDRKVQRVKEPTDEARRKKLEKLEAREAKRREKIQKAHAAAPAAAKKAIQKLLDQTKPKAPKKKEKKSGTA